MASFLAKDLLIDWRQGKEQVEKWRLCIQQRRMEIFGQHRSGPATADLQSVDESEKFDKERIFVRKWVHELRNVEGKPFTILTPITNLKMQKMDVHVQLWTTANVDKEPWRGTRKQHKKGRSSSITTTAIPLFNFIQHSLSNLYSTLSNFISTLEHPAPMSQTSPQSSSPSQQYSSGRCSRRSWTGFSNQTG